MSRFFNRASKEFLLFTNSLTILLVIVSLQFIFPQSRLAYAASVEAFNWSGYEATGPLGTYRGIRAAFIIPRIAPIANTVMSIEVGLGGDASLTPQIEMVEAGIKLAWDSTTGKQMTVPWWEVTGNRKDMPPQNAALSMKAGDRIQVYVSSNMNNNGKDVFTIQNLTTKKTFTHTLADPTALSDGASAPCLIMRPTTTDANSHKQVVAALANFGKMTVQNCSIYTSAQQRNNWAPIGNMVHDNINMHSEFANHSIIATTSALRHGVDFDVTWLGTGSAPTPTSTSTP